MKSQSDWYECPVYGSHSQPLHPQGSYGHHLCHLLSSPHFCADPLTQALAISGLEVSVQVLQSLLILIFNFPKITYTKASLENPQ